MSCARVSSVLPAAAFLTACYFSADEMRDLLPEAVASARAEVAVRRNFVCALVVFSPSTGDLAAWEAALADGVDGWRALPFEEKVHELSILYRIVNNSDNCWTDEARRALGGLAHEGLFDAANGAFMNDGGGEAVFYLRRQGKFVAIAG